VRRPATTRPAAVLAALAALLGPSTVALAKVPADKAAELDGPRLTCMGAERAGSDSGVAAYTGQWLGTWPGNTVKEGYTPGPYADEKPLFTITAANAAQYAAQLTEGQKALLKKYPKQFRMHVYPSHRDFRFPDWVCDTVKKNAVTAEVIHDGLGITGTSGAIAFPFPRSGLEAIWNVVLPYRPWNEAAVVENAVVKPNGIQRGKQRFRTLSMSTDPRKRGSNQDKVSAYFFNEWLAPPREAGQISVGSQPNDFKTERTHAWFYSPGLRRSRRAPEIGFDHPVPPAGMHTVDDNYIFNGSPERYDWKLVGKREAFIPYHNFAVNDPAVKTDALLTPGTLNPDFVRYELHRVWVIEGNLKQGLRHAYRKRVLYADEDTWLVSWGENYDMRGQLWRVPMVLFRYAPEAQAFHRGVSVYHDLTANAYEAIYLVNESGDNWWKLNDPAMKPEMFSSKVAGK
jgi:hypothetical protein